MLVDLVALSLRRTVWTLALIIEGLLLAAGCAPSSQATTPRGTDIVIFIDFSASVQGPDRALLKQDLVTQIIPSLSAGDRIVIAPINDKTLTDFHPLVEVNLPPKPEFNGWLDNVMKYTRQVKENESQVVHLKETIGTQVADIFAKRFSSQYTDIFSSLIIAQQLFHNESRRKVLVLMSDMVEDHPPYRFDKISWSTATNQKLLSELDAKGLVPDLSGVCVYVSGASAESAELAGNIGQFWQAYFQHTKADMDPSRYAHVLLHWPPSKSCRSNGASAI